VEKPVPKPPSIASALASLRDRKPVLADKSAAFPLPLASHRQHAANQSVGRKQIQRFVKADNARDWVASFPGAGEILRSYLPGDFIFGDILPMIVDAYGQPSRIDISSLSLSLKNIESLALLLDRGIPITLALSHYFRATNTDIFAAIVARLTAYPHFQLAVSRIHAKTYLLDFPAGTPPITIESSANLRTSGTIEFATVTRCPEVHRFHLEFLAEFHRIAHLGQHTDFTAYAGPPDYRTP
jgi:hypothetical protein